MHTNISFYMLSNQQKLNILQGTWTSYIVDIYACYTDSINLINVK